MQKYYRFLTTNKTNGILKCVHMLGKLEHAQQVEINVGRYFYPAIIEHVWTIRN